MKITGGRVGRLGLRVLLACAMAAVSLVAAAPVASAAGIRPCLNYETRQEFGRVAIDLRKDKSGGQTVLTVWWFITGDPVGPYTHQHFVNGRPVGGVQPATKDDNLHTALRATGDNGKTINWKFGDIYSFRGTHYAPAERATYITPVNQCRITAR